jgi:ubiquinone/menaquinone biosynthesis C-methylase UbiE
MTKLDVLIQRQRIKKIKPFIHPGAAVLDIGCGDGALFKQISHIAGVGIDPTLPSSLDLPNAKLVSGKFPDDVPQRSEKFDCVTMLAVLEHLPPSVQSELGESCYRVLKPKGKVIVTVPSRRTDVVLAALKRLRLIHGMSLEEHYGYDVKETPRLFPSFKLISRKTFQLGFNNLFVFEKT